MFSVQWIISQTASTGLLQSGASSGPHQGTGPNELACTQRQKDCPRSALTSSWLILWRDQVGTPRLPLGAIVSNWDNVKPQISFHLLMDMARKYIDFYTYICVYIYIHKQLMTIMVITDFFYRKTFLFTPFCFFKIFFFFSSLVFFFLFLYYFSPPLQQRAPALLLHWYYSWMDSV